MVPFAHSSLKKIAISEMDTSQNLQSKEGKKKENENKNGYSHQNESHTVIEKKDKKKAIAHFGFLH
ncbi:hypothetical protein RFI_18980 [Reticulomyxa filosa]|uniref:Uncharacterized protein n=1 Tax=Reticulomyxa filosa TaxID=46433 RepID=X6MWB5_RETFI|nr:hypothetical protein RFI_18980 [Reticulomyxa filosa]|eukprot:ETO18298.1 hypothetical protein RFI_18980 [Reticulomyxa filosa]